MQPSHVTENDGGYILDKMGRKLFQADLTFKVNLNKKEMSV